MDLSAIELKWAYNTSQYRVLQETTVMELQK